MKIKELNKKKLKRMIISSSAIFIGIAGFNIYKNKNVINISDEEMSSQIINTIDFTLGLKKVAQLEYAVGDKVINVNEGYDLYKTFEQNSKYEIFIDKKSEEINSLHYVSNVNDINENDMKYLKNIYSLSFANMSNSLFEKTKDILNIMCSEEYLSGKTSSILKNNFITEVITIGKTSEIKITVLYNAKGMKVEPLSVDIAILKGNKW